VAASVRVTAHHTNTDDGSTTDVAGTTIFFKAVGDTDTNTSGVAHNGAGTNYSLIKTYKLYVQSAPIHLINNFKWIWSGSQVTAIDVVGKVTATYIDPVAQSTTALTGTSSMYAATAAVPLSQDGSFVTGTDTAPKFVGNFLVLQLAVGNAAVANAVTLGSLIARYDES
jgi:hypothetical protein